MSIFQKPRSTYVQLSPEWWLYSMACGGLRTGTLPDLYSNVSLYNNSNAGESLFVYLVAMWSPEGGNLSMFTRSGEPAVIAGSCLPLDSAGAAPPGLIGSDTWPVAQPHTAPVFKPWDALGVIGGTWPISIVRPGYSLTIQSDINADDIAVTFYYRHGPN